eukprot:TRINITY_DN3475_c2_g1_i2.p1 TRINITY_DN3475_c2_g1~~TRINITY_DN3475_c2_g1_i2.p1  ORF type:complete len:710 (-),score=187.73 TRINITY_DN3475_c2_g1_i2:174-2303(-)
MNNNNEEENNVDSIEERLNSIIGEGDGTGLIIDDKYLESFSYFFRDHFSSLKFLLQDIKEKEGNLLKFSKGYEEFGFHVVNNGIYFKEYAPSAKAIHLFGDFNDWNRDSHPLIKEEFGRWSIFLPDIKDENGNYIPRISHNSKIKLCITISNGERVDRIPTYSTKVVQEITIHEEVLYNSIFWNPPEPYKFKFPKPETKNVGLKIYEAHVGMSSEEYRINTYIEFKDNVLPHIIKSGYNCIQLMGIMEHSYYASFGYQVTNFYACSSRYGTPDELKELIDVCHKHNIIVLLDVVHSHASRNVGDGLNEFDGTEHCYFHGGKKGYHPVWDSRLFNYGNWETLRFLLSNLRFWIDVYQFDGFRFDGVTSMIYTNHGIGSSFAGGYKDYFGKAQPPIIDTEATLYLTLSNVMLHCLDENIITIAEDVSGLPGLCIEVKDGGMGFDYRLGMGIPDMWVKLLKKVKDENWNIGHIVYTLTNRRYKEKTISYAECHDQSLVGDKTIAFWLMDKEMYSEMSVLNSLTPVIDRGISLHKLIRLLTSSLGGEGYLNFMGNEFGHPEWVDFPREGNNNSFQYARRQWSLVKDKLLRYQHLFNFDIAMNTLEDTYPYLSSPPAYVSYQHEEDKIIVFERGNLIFVFNFNPSVSFSDYRVPSSKPGKYIIALNSDNVQYGGHNRVNNNSEYFTSNYSYHDFQHSFLIYIPNRCALVFALAD